jgi:integrase
MIIDGGIPPQNHIRRFFMSIKKQASQYFHEYFSVWVEVYKQGAVRLITHQKYLVTLRRLAELAPNLKICELDKRSYQNLINSYAQTHEKQTTMDFHNHLKSAIMDAIDEGVLSSDPTRKVIIKGKEPAKKKPKFLSQFELQALLKTLNLSSKPNWDWFILLVAKTGLRFSEALALTPSDFDLTEQKIKITKTWNYKNATGNFGDTKNFSSKRTLSIDPQLCKQFRKLTKLLSTDEPIFISGRVFNSTVNNRLKSLCKKAGVPVISLHSLRHTHASLLIYAGVSIVSIAKRLGHSSVTTTQETYLHIIQELENQDNKKIIRHLSALI